MASARGFPRKWRSAPTRVRFLGTPDASGLQIITGLLFLTAYYLSRFRGLHRPLYWPFVILIALFLSLNAVVSGGSAGSAFLYFTVALVIAVILFRAVGVAGISAVFGLGVGRCSGWSTSGLNGWFHPDQQTRVLDVGGNLLFSLAPVAVLVLLLTRNLNLELAKSGRLVANMRAVTQSAADAIISADRDGNVICWNRSAERMFGFSESEVLGTPLTLIIPERYRQAHHDGMA